MPGSRFRVDLHRVAACARRGRGDDALAYARTIDRAAIDRLPRERRSAFLLDLATVRRQAGRAREAVDCLLELDRITPEEVRCRPAGRELIATLAEQAGHTQRFGPVESARRAGITA